MAGTTQVPQPAHAGRASRRGRMPLLAMVALLIYVPTALAVVVLAPYAVSGAVVWGSVLLAVTIPVVMREARAHDDERLGRVICWALAIKLLASLVRWYVGEEIYGSTDATGYINNGERLANSYRALDFDEELGRAFIGTGAMRVITGVIFTVTGRTDLGAYVIYAWFGFVGLWCFYRAFRLALPDVRPHRYAYLLFFLPSMLYWPSSVGKEAWMMLTLGVATLGVARSLAHGRGALPLMLIGFTGAAIVRPHMAALLAGGFGAALLLRRSDGRNGATGGKVAMLLLLAVGGVLILQSLETRFGFDLEEGVGGVETVVDEAADRTDQGGSAFEAERVQSAADLPTATLAVLFRPFPWEAHNLQALLSSFEGLMLLALFVFGAARLARLPRQMFARPYLMLAALYSLGFIVAFSSFGNFGILARQRTQLFPFVLVLLTGVAVDEHRRRRAPR